MIQMIKMGKIIMIIKITKMKKIIQMDPNGSQLIQMDPKQYRFGGNPLNR